MMTHTWLLKSAVAMAAIGLCGTAIAQSYPARTIRFVITYPPGGGSDFTVRPIAQKLSETWGQPVLVESRPGGSAMIGTDFVVRSPPDGYTVLLSGSSEVSTNVALVKKMPYDPVRDLQPVTLVCTAPLVLVAHPSLPVKSVKELVALARAKPGFDIVQWFAIWLPAKTPKDIAGKLHGEVVRIVQSPDYKQRQFEVAADVVGSSPEALANLQKTEIDKYRKIAASAGIAPE
jgi:tripartite-type tricarboxylate transporter receptor subunit TctC